MRAMSEPLLRDFDPARHPGLRLLILHGSRARGDARPDSDWDFGFVAGEGFDVDALLTDLTRRLRADRIDLVDLARAGGLIRYRAARDAKTVFARDDRVFPDFWFEAVRFWCEAGPVLDRAYEDRLARLGP